MFCSTVRTKLQLKEKRSLYKLGATNGSFPWNICSEDLDRIFGHSDEKLARVLGKTFILCVSNVEQIKNSSP